LRLADAGGPAPAEEFVDAVDGMRGDAGEHVAQPGERVDAVQLAGLDQTIDGGGTLSAGVRSREQPILPAEGDAADGVFGAVVVDLQPAIPRDIPAPCLGRWS
jgi:hypothetical protein